MTYSRLARVLGLTLVACGPAPGGESGSETTQSSTTAAASTSESPTTSTTSTTSTSGPAPTTGPADPTTGPATTVTTEVGTTTTGVTTDEGTSTGTTGPVSACDGEEFTQDPEDRLPGGLEQCADGTVHRHTAVTCAHPYEPNVCDERGGCDEPCDALGDGSCTELFQGFCRCAFPCSSDADCSADAACLCAGGVGDSAVLTTTECLPANCRTDADCGDFECGLSPDFCFGAEGLFCRSAADECRSQADCPPGKHCSFETDVQLWVCIDTGQCE